MNPIIPQAVIEIRSRLCRGRCDVDPANPCSSCPNGHWGKYSNKECEDGTIQHAGPIRVVLPEIKPSPHLKPGPGGIFSMVIYKITGQVPGSCGKCSSRIAQMNQWGWWKCFLNRATIISWLSEEAKRRGHIIGDREIWGLMKAARRELRYQKTKWNT